MIDTTKTILLLVLLALAACSDTKEELDRTTGNTQSVFWINSMKANCSGVGLTQCLQIQRGETIIFDNWELFYADIRGFDYEPGNIYRVSVLEESLPQDQISADVSSINYRLLKVIEKNIDTQLRLNDIWALEKIGAEAVSIDKQSRRPQLELQLQGMRIMGTDGCNNIRGSIDYIDHRQLTFGTIASTKKLCIDMNLADRFLKQLESTRAYVIEDRRLRLFDDNDELMMVLKKMD